MPEYVAILNLNGFRWEFNPACLTWVLSYINNLINEIEFLSLTCKIDL